jgi:hypothetical protein
MPGATPRREDVKRRRKRSEGGSRWLVTSSGHAEGDSQKRKSGFEIGHVLFIDVAGYSKLTTEEESEIEIDAG